MIRLVTLGSVDVVSDAPTDAATILHEPARFAVLVFIGTCRGGFACRDRLTTLLWPSSTPGKARNALRQCLHRIRTLLGHDVIMRWGNGDLALDPARIEVDVALFEKECAAGHAEEAMALYRGGFLQGLPSLGRREFDDWVEGRREELRRKALQCAVALADRAEREQRFEAASDWWGSAMALAPFDEGLLRRQMRCLVRAGSPSRAIRVFRRVERQVRNELELPLDYETRAVACEIIDSLRSDQGSFARS